MSIAIAFHVFGALIWVGGMFFAHMILRPSALSMEPPERLSLWQAVFSRFFRWVWFSILSIWLSGLWILFYSYQSMDHLPIYIHIMLATGLLMSLIFSLIFFSPYAQFKHQIRAKKWPKAAQSLARIRLLVTINLVLGLFTVLIAVTKMMF